MPEQLNFGDLSEVFAKRLIYVIGSARGGSTLANRAIGAHPGILEVRWNDKTFSDVWPHRDRLGDEQLRERILGTGRIYDANVAANHIGAANVALWQAHVDRVCAARDLRQFFCLRGILAWIMTGAGTKPESLQGWCVKANTWEGIDALKQAIPEAKLVFVQRDPRSTALSFAKVFARKRLGSFDDGDCAHGAMDWLRNATEFAVRLKRYPDAQLLYYEELVADPVPALNRLFQRLGLQTVEGDRLKSLLAAVRYSATRTQGERGQEPPQTGITTSAVNRWRQQLSARQLDLICALTAPGANYYGYRFDQRPSGGVLAMTLAQRGLAANLLPRYFYCRTRLALLEAAGGRVTPVSSAP